MNTHRVMAAAKRVALVGAGAAAGVIMMWIVSEAVGTEVGAGSLFACFVVVLPTCLAVDVLSGPTADARIASGVAAGGATVIFWAGVEMMDRNIEHAVYIILFTVTFAVHFLHLRRRERRSRKTPASPHR